MTGAADRGTRLARTRAAEYAVGLVREGEVVGLGSGRAATSFVRALAEAVARGLRVRGVATSDATAREATRLEVPLADLGEVDAIDISVDGADEVDPDFNLIKGRGGALVRERVVEAASKRRIIVVGAEKLVPVLGTTGGLPVEIIPFALPVCLRQLAERGLRPSVRMSGDQPYRTDNGNSLVECQVCPIADPARLEREIRALPGVVDTGLFLRMADIVLVQDGGDLVVRERRRELNGPAPGTAETRR